MSPPLLDRRQFLRSVGALGGVMSLGACKRSPALAPIVTNRGDVNTMDSVESYGHLRGFNYTPSTTYNDIAFWRDYDEALIERELTYAQRLGLNSVRPFLAYVVYEHDPQTFLQRLRHFVRAAHDRDITTMPVLWDSCFSEIRPTYDADLNDWIPNPGVQRLGSDFWPEGERYCRDLVEVLGPESGLAMWDVMNEPMITSWIRPDAPERDRRIETIWRFVHHFCGVLKKADNEHPITVGVHRASMLDHVGDQVDVLSFHDYQSTRAAIRAHIDEAVEVGRRFGKPIFISEMGCLARANPYDMTLEICHDKGIGWYLWELMIGASRWRDIHGIVYPDGTVRDPSIVAAVQGFFRKRAGDVVSPNLDKEGAVKRVLDRAEHWLSDSDDPYAYQPHANGLALLEEMGNLLEAGELVPMIHPPSVTVRSLEEGNLDNLEEVQRLLVEWSEVLKRAQAIG